MPVQNRAATPLPQPMPDQPARAIRVVIIEDQRRIREGLEALIGGTEGYACSSTFRSMEEALAQQWADIPDVVLVDIGLPGMSGIEGIRLLREKYPATVLVMLTVYEDDDRIFKALCAGACGYLLKKTPPVRLLQYLKDVMSGGSAISPEVARRVIDLFRSFKPPERADYNLTPHEARLLKMLMEGHNYKTAAAAMGVSFNTIAFHMKNVYQKLQVHSKSEAVAKALRTKLIG
jgi:DNA-binding NarL/FixJ family response regulator